MTTLPAWHYDEFRHVGVDYSDPAQAAVYEERHGQLGDLTAEYRRVLEAINLQPEQTLLDLGAGTGRFACFAAPHCAQVYVADVALPMLAYARQQAEAAGLSNMTFVRGGFLTYAHPGVPVDAVVSMVALHHLPDFWKLIGLQKVASVLKEGGVFYLKDTVYSFDPREYMQFFEEQSAWFAAHVDAGFHAEAMLAFREEFSTLDWIMEGLLERAGFTILQAQYPQELLAHYLCVKR